MAKQTLDLFKLFKLVTDRGGLVEVIFKMNNVNLSVSTRPRATPSKIQSVHA